MTTTIIVAIVAVVVALLIAVPVTCKVAVNNKIQNLSAQKMNWRKKPRNEETNCRNMKTVY